MKSNGIRYSPAFKFQVVLAALKAEGKRAEAQVARASGVHPVTLAKWKRHFLEHGAEVFGGKNGDASRVTGFYRGADLGQEAGAGRKAPPGIRVESLPAWSFGVQVHLALQQAA